MGLIESAAADAVGAIDPPVGLALKAWTDLKSVAGWLIANPMIAIAIVAAIFGAWEWHEAGAAEKIAAQDKATIAAIQTSTAQAVASATKAKEATDAKNAKLAADSDKTAADLRTRYDAAVVRLAAAQGAAGHADLPGDAEPAQGGDGSDHGALVPAGTLTISTDDALTCGDNTARLQAVQQWAAGLEAEK